MSGEPIRRKRGGRQGWDLVGHGHIKEVTSREQVLSEAVGEDGNTLVREKEVTWYCCAYCGDGYRCRTLNTSKAVEHLALRCRKIPAEALAKLDEETGYKTIKKRRTADKPSTSAVVKQAQPVPETSTSAPVYAVFGATGGIGSELCKKLLAQDGAKVAMVARNSDKLGELVDTLGSGNVLSIPADPLDPKAMDAAIAQVVKDFGRVDGVANCVGSVLLKAAHTTSDAEFMDIINTNLVTSFNILRPSVKTMMRNGGGSIAFCSSAVAQHGLMNHEAIAAAKAGVAGLARSAAATYAGKNIRVNCVAPGLTRTPLAERITSSEAALKASTSMHALKRIGEPGEVAAALEFLLHPSNSWITGQNLGVDGGLGSIRSTG